MNYYVGIALVLLSTNLLAASQSICTVKIKRFSSDTVSVPGLGLSSQLYMIEKPEIPAEKEISVRDCYYSSMQFISAYKAEAILTLKIQKSSFWGLWKSKSSQDILLKTVASWKHIDIVDGKKVFTKGVVSNFTEVSDEISASESNYMIIGNQAVDSNGNLIKLNEDAHLFDLIDDSVLTELD